MSPGANLAPIVVVTNWMASGVIGKTLGPYQVLGKRAGGPSSARVPSDDASYGGPSVACARTSC
jgi:hypothetical protein